MTSVSISPASCQRVVSRFDAWCDTVPRVREGDALLRAPISLQDGTMIRRLALVMLLSFTVVGATADGAQEAALPAEAQV